MQELSAKYPDLVAAALEMYNLEHPQTKSNTNWTYGIASNDTTAKKEDAKKKTTAQKGNGGDTEEDEDYLSGGMTEEEIWALRGLNPDYVSKNRTAKEIEALYADSVYRATDPTYSSVIDPYFAVGTPSTTNKPAMKTGTPIDLPTMANYMSPESMAIYLAELERLKATKK
jgi:hypothetical protein